MHLSYKSSKYKDKVYKSYFLAESYREGKSVKKRILCKIGKLTDLQAQQIRKICKVSTDPNQSLTTIKDIVVQECKVYGEVAVANALWEKWELSRAFQCNPTDSEFSTDLIARILTVCRCISPCSHYSIPEWIAKTAISEITGHDLRQINEHKIYYELDKIDQNHENLEQHLFQMTYSKDPFSYQYVNYDLSSSYFVGFKCNLAHYGKSKDDKPHNKQVVLGILVNDKGYPFKWDVYPGNMAEVHTLTHNIDACVKRFKLKNINLVFDRGIVSDDNLTKISNEKLKYISALDRDQISKIDLIDFSIIEKITASNYATHLLTNGFKKYDNSLLFKDLGLKDERRYVLGFNPDLFGEERKCRKEKMICFEKFLIEKNKELANAKRSRKQLSTQQSVLNELKRLKIRKYYKDPELTPIEIKRENKKGQQYNVTSFNVSISKKDDVIKTWERLDGLCMFVSNHIETTENHFQFPADKIILAYREKTKIEDAFKHIKSFLKLRPFFVNTDAHVRAVYDISVLSYFLNKDLAERRRKIDQIDYLNSKNLYEPFKRYFYTTIKDKASGETKSGPMEFSLKMKDYLGKLNLEM